MKQLIPSDPREWLWNAPARLAGVARPRILRWESQGLPPRVRACRDNFALLGQERHFRRAEGIRGILRLMRGQSEFLATLFGSFFTDRDAPALVTILSARMSFWQRMEVVRSRMSHQVQLGERLFTVARTKRCRIALNGQPLPMRGASFFHHHDLPDARLRMQELVVHRSLEGDGLGPAATAREHWFLLASPEPSETRDLLNGRNPSLETFRDPNTGLQTAPLLSLTRFNETGRSMLGRCICLRPYVGEIIDLRSYGYRLDYFFRSDRTNHWAAQDLLIPGRYELL
jgi:hypothetical protein